MPSQVGVTATGGGGGAGGGLTDAQLRAAPVPVSGGGGGTEYQEDVAAPADPFAGARVWRRRDALVAEVSTDGDWVIANGTGKGELYVKHVDAIAVTGTFWQATQPVSGPLTDAQLRAVAVPVSGTFWQATQPVSGTFWQATQPVSGTFWQATQPVSGPLTDAQLRASAVPVTIPTPVPVTDNSGSLTVDGVFWQATQPVSLAAGVDITDRVGRLLGHVTVDNASLAVTGTFWQATQPVSGTFWQATQPVSIAATVNTDVIDRSARLLGHVTVDNASLAVTGTFWQATQPVSGPLTNAELRATPVPVSGAFTSAVDDTGATQTLNVQNVDGHRVLFVADPFQRRLLEEQLLELRILNANLAELVSAMGGTPTSPRVEYK